MLPRTCVKSRKHWRMRYNERWVYVRIIQYTENFAALQQVNFLPLLSAAALMPTAFFPTRPLLVKLWTPVRERGSFVKLLLLDNRPFTCCNDMNTVDSAKKLKMDSFVHCSIYDLKLKYHEGWSVAHNHPGQICWCHFDFVDGIRIFETKKSKFNSGTRKNIGIVN